MIRWSASVASDDAYLLGEGPFWDGPRGRVLWVDVDRGTVHAGLLDGERVVPVDAWQLDRTVGAVVCSADGELLVAGAQVLLTIDGARRGDPLISGRRRFNDGACDPVGRFLVGTLALDEPAGHEVLLRVEDDGSATVLDDDLTLSNGLAWSVDGSLLYSVDTIPGVVWVRSYDAATGAVGPRREWVRLADGWPDGLCVDAQDHVWVAVWGGGQVRRFAPDGSLVGVVDVPAPHTTSVAFVGDDLDVLLITTATAQLDAARLAEFPDSGRHFLARVGVTGHPVTAWAGP